MDTEKMLSKHRAGESETADDSGKRKDEQKIHEVMEDDGTVALKRLCNKKR